MDRSRGMVGCIEIDVMTEAWLGDMSFIRSIAMTSGLSFGRLLLSCAVVRVRDMLLLSSFARGCVVKSPSSESSSESSNADESLRRFFELIAVAACAHFGRGFKSSNCWRSLRWYSLPVITSSPSYLRSFLRRGTDMSDTIMRSSSLSSHAVGARCCEMTSL